MPPLLVTAEARSTSPATSPDRLPPQLRHITQQIRKGEKSWFSQKNRGIARPKAGLGTRLRMLDRGQASS